MRRIVGVIIFVIGLALLVGGIVGKTFGLAQTGGFAMFIGLLVFGLSFIRPHQPAPDAPPPLPPAERIAGIFYEPSRIFQNLRHHPRWLAAFLVIALSSIIYQVAFTQRLTPEVIAGTTADKVIEGGWIPPDRAAGFREQQIEEATSPVARVTAPLSQVGALFIFMLVLAGLYLLGVMLFGGRMNFWQALAVATHAMLPPIVIEKLLSIVLLYIQSPDDIDPIKGQQRGLVRADLGILFNPAEHPYLYTLASFIGILTFYTIWLTATGLRHTGEKVSTGAAWTITLILWGIGLVLALAAAAIFPSFVT